MCPSATRLQIASPVRSYQDNPDPDWLMVNLFGAMDMHHRGKHICELWPGMAHDLDGPLWRPGIRFGDNPHYYIKPFDTGAAADLGIPNANTIRIFLGYRLD
jgi:hypothetical protein